jgi:hypothetical protein
LKGCCGKRCWDEADRHCYTGRTYTLGAGPNVNVGIIDPILLQGLANRFEVQVSFVVAQDRRIGYASKQLLITHIVIDDRMVCEF